MSRHVPRVEPNQTNRSLLVMVRLTKSLEVDSKSKDEEMHIEVSDFHTSSWPYSHCR